MSGNILLSLYCKLVVLELLLKDYQYGGMAQWERGHDVPSMLTNLSDPGITSLAIQLRTALSCLTCTLPDGTEGQVAARSFPDLRYLRHASDYPGKSTDNEIQSALVLANDIEVALTAQGVI